MKELWTVFEKGLLMVFWRAWDVRNGALKAGRPISIEGSVIFLKSYMESLSPDLSMTEVSQRKGIGASPTMEKMGLVAEGTSQSECGWGF